MTPHSTKPPRTMPDTPHEFLRAARAPLACLALGFLLAGLGVVAWVAAILLRGPASPPEPSALRWIVYGLAPFPLLTWGLVALVRSRIGQTPAPAAAPAPAPAEACPHCTADRSAPWSTSPHEARFAAGYIYLSCLGAMLGVTGMAAWFYAVRDAFPDGIEALVASLLIGTAAFLPVLAWSVLHLFRSRAHRDQARAPECGHSA